MVATKTEREREGGGGGGGLWFLGSPPQESITQLPVVNYSFESKTTSMDYKLNVLTYTQGQTQTHTQSTCKPLLSVDTSSGC